MPEEGLLAPEREAYRATVSTDTEATTRSPLVVLLTGLLALGVARAAGRLIGLVALLGVVVATVAALAIGIVVLRLVLA
jgi:hypothetical protein